MYSELEPDAFYLDIVERIIFRLKARLQAIDVENKININEWLDTPKITDYLTFDKFFREFHAKLPKKVFMIIDEFDGIPKKVLRNFLHTLRQIYHEKKLDPSHNYIHSIGIVGVKSVAQLDFDHTVSPFNCYYEPKGELYYIA